MEIENKISNVQFIKTILMLIIILGHACNYWTGNWFTENPVIKNTELGIFTVWLNSFHIYTFTLISGYLFSFKVLKGAYNSYSLFLNKKVRRLLVPYVFSMLIWVAPISAYFFNWGIVELFTNYVLCINPSQLWFLWMIFGVFVIVWPIRKVMIENPVVGWIIAVTFYGIGIIGIRIIPNVFCIWTTCQYIVFFYIGMRIRVKSENKENLFTNRIHWLGWLVLDLAIFLLYLWMSAHNGLIMKIMTLGINFLLHIVGAIMAWVILQKIANYIPWRDNRIFEKLSAYSMPMYLFHQQLIYFTIALLDGIVNPWINALINFAVATIGSYFISLFFMRWNITKFLIGEK